MVRPDKRGVEILRAAAQEMVVAQPDLALFRELDVRLQPPLAAFSDKSLRQRWAFVVGQYRNAVGVLDLRGSEAAKSSVEAFALSVEAFANLKELGLDLDGPGF